MHNKNIIYMAVAGLLSAGCSNSSLAPRSNDSFMVESIPSGSTVYVMGEIIGTTPLEVETRQVFPLSYPSEQSHQYGHVFFSHEGCEELANPVGTGHVSKGMKVKLRCAPITPVAQPIQAAPTSAEKDIKQRLRELKALFEEGLIEQDDYDTKRQEILKGL